MLVTTRGISKRLEQVTVVTASLESVAIGRFTDTYFPISPKKPSGLFIMGEFVICKVGSDKVQYGDSQWLV